jgi:hypothetical protein
MVIRLPSGSSPGQYFAAIASLTMITSGAWLPSRSVKPRPFRTGMPIVAKYSGLIAKKAAERRCAGSLGRPSMVKPTPMLLPDNGSVVETADAVAPGIVVNPSRSRV